MSVATLKYDACEDCYVDSDGRRYSPESLSEETKRKLVHAMPQTYTRDHNQREAAQYDINTDTISNDSMVLTDTDVRKVELGEQRTDLIKYLESKVRSRNDWHAVQDAASDIREIEARIAELSEK